MPSLKHEKLDKQYTLTLFSLLRELVIGNNEGRWADRIWSQEILERINRLEKMSCWCLQTTSASLEIKEDEAFERGLISGLNDMKTMHPRGKKQVELTRQRVAYLHSKGYSQRQIQKLLQFKSHSSVEKHLARIKQANSHDQLQN